tara:strand:- start:19552 stop:20007 length:456 start_codon:yes stop_codon:yes gene_type:complete
MKLNFKNPVVVFFGVFVAALLGCAVGCTLALKFFMGGHHGASGHDPHDWLHHQLGITHEQHEQLKDMETRFESRERELRDAILAANAKLTVALKEDQTYTPRVEAIIEEIHHAQAALQKATIEHLVEMKTVLTVEQYQKLLDLAGDALSDF